MDLRYEGRSGDNFPVVPKAFLVNLNGVCGLDSDTYCYIVMCYCPDFGVVFRLLTWKKEPVCGEHKG